jgi:tRNA(Ile)-lysidine synthase
MGGILWSATHAALHRRLHSRSLLPPRHRSGGGVRRDSVCLLGLLVDLRPQWSWQLRAVHCDHRWRADSAANGVFVAELCDRWRVPCAVVVAEGNDRDGRTEAARQWRHTTFEQVATAQGCTRAVSGHTASDRQSSA